MNDFIVTGMAILFLGGSAAYALAVLLHWIETMIRKARR